MKIVRYILVALMVNLMTWGISSAGEKHWVYDELAGFKQSILPVVKTIPANGIVTEAEWKSVHTNVLHEERLDEPISARDWAAMLQMVLHLPESQKEQLLQMYVFGLTSDQYISREDAVGGLVKLLTLDHLKGSFSAEELKDANNLKDLGKVSERQDVLVRIAYCEGLLDNNVNDYFRPQDQLTNAEAVSMLNKVLEKYAISLKLRAALKQNHWASGATGELAGKMKGHAEFISILENIIYDDQNANNPCVLDKPVTVENWNSILFAALELEDSQYEKDFLEGYTYGLAEEGYVPRDKAVAGAIKLLHASEKLPGRDATDMEREAAAMQFNDYNLAFDTSKLAIALSEGLVSGYAGGSFKPQQLLTNAEAVTFVTRIVNKYN